MNSRTLFTNALIYYHEKFQIGFLLIEMGKIKDIGINFPETNDFTGNVINVNGKMMIPGFIDIHTHGGGGFEFMHAAEDKNILDKLSLYYAASGTTSFIASTYTENFEKTKQTIILLKEYIEKQNNQSKGSNLAGIHIEGPYINKEKKGAQNSDYIRKPNINELTEMIELSGNHIRLLTIAPEIEGALEVIRFLKKRGIVVAIGHSVANYETACRAIDNGASLITHFFNGLNPFDHKQPGVVGAGLFRDDITLELICDGHHLHPDLIKYILKTKGADKVVFISDSVFVAGCANGDYKLGGLDVVKSDNKITLKNGGNLAGSSLTMIEAFRNAIFFTGLAIEKIIPAFTQTPAKLIGIEKTKGSLEIGKDADFLIIDNKLILHSVYCRGVEQI